MNKNNRQQLLARLDLIEKKARGSRWQRFLSQPVRYLKGTLFHKLVYPITRKARFSEVETFFGQKMKLLIPAGLDIYLLRAKTHDSEIRLSRLLIRQLKETDTFVDVGAHFGFFSLLAQQLLPQGRVFSIEASAAMTQILQQNTQKSTIQTFHLAVSKVNELLTFYEFPILYSEYNTLHPEQYQQSAWLANNPPKAIEVRGRRLSDFFSEQKINPNWIKIDVEGAEADAIEGLTDFLNADTANSPSIVLEYLSAARQNESHRRAAHLLKQCGYKSFTISARGELQLTHDIEESLRAQQTDSDNIVFQRKEA